MAEWYKELGMSLHGDPFMLLLEYIGTFAGAISGVRMACAKRFDWFGAYVIGFVTALGGGTLRDIMLNISPFWMGSPSYLIVTFSACVAVFLFGRRFISEAITWFIFDTIAISLFTVFGLEKALLFGFPWWCAISMGVITAVFGGVLRDICINQVPLIFRKELYAMACVAGGVLYIVILHFYPDAQKLSALLCVVTIFVLRALAIRFGWRIPVLSGLRPHLPWRTK